MSDTRCRTAAARLVMAEPMPFGQRYEYHDEIAIEAMLAAAFFLPLARRFRTGDHLILVALEAGGRRVAEEQAFRVVEAGPGALDIRPCGERHTYIYAPDTTAAPVEPAETTHKPARKPSRASARAAA